MKLTDQLVLACTLLGITDAAPPVANPGGKGFSIAANLQPVAAADRHQKRSLHAINKVKRRYMTGDAPKAPQNFQRAKAVKSKKGSNKSQVPIGGGKTVANSLQDDMQYICEVDIGGQKMRLNFDTGSSDLWLYSTHQPAIQQKGHQVYNVKKSNAGGAPMPGGTWNISYGDGSSAGGVVHIDKVSVGGVSYPKQAFGLAMNVSESFFQDNTNDGLLGLGFTTGPISGSGNTISVDGTTKPQNTFFTNIRSSLPAPLFTVDLKHRAAGSYDFGYIDKSKYTGDIVYFPANSSQAYWQIASQSYGIKGDKPVTKTIQTIIDTGTTLMLVPQDVLDHYYAKVPKSTVDKEAGGYTYPCGTKLPDFNIGFDQAGAKFTATIPSKYMDFGPATVGSSTCFGSMQVMSKSDSLDAIYGDIFLKAVFTVFEAKTDESPRMGFAMKPEAVDSIGKPNPASTTSTSSTPSPTSSSTPAGTDCAVTLKAEGAMGWFKDVLEKVKAFFAGKKKDVCISADASSDGGKDGVDAADDDPVDNDAAGGDEWDDETVGEEKKESKKEKELKKKKAELKKAIKVAKMKLRAREWEMWGEEEEY